MSRPAHKPTDEGRRRVKTYAAVGVPHHDIARIMRMDTKTLLKHYRVELDLGKAEANAAVGGQLYKMAMSGNVAAAIFWMKAQAGWRERAEVDVRHPDGVKFYLPRNGREPV